MTNLPVQTKTLDLIGNTPLVLMDGPSKAAGCEIWGKCEFANPGASVKDRAALWIIRDAEKRGELKPGGTVVEGTAGNTGIGIALVANALGYKSVIVMPDNQSKEKMDTLRALGAQLVTVPPTKFADPNHFVPHRLTAVPRPVFGNEDVAPILLREHPAGIKLHAQRGDMRAQLLRRCPGLRTGTPAAELRIGDVRPVTVRKPEMKSCPRSVIQLIRRAVIAQPVPPVIGEPQLFGDRMPVKPDGIADTRGVNVPFPVLQVDPQDRRITGIAAFADITGRAHRHIQPPVGTEGDELPSVPAVGGKIVINDHRFRRIVQPLLDIVVAQDPIHLGDVQRSVAEGDPVGHVQPPIDQNSLIGLFVAIPIRHRVHIPGGPRPDEQYPLWA